MKTILSPKEQPQRRGLLSLPGEQARDWRWGRICLLVALILLLSMLLPADPPPESHTPKQPRAQVDDSYRDTGIARLATALKTTEHARTRVNARHNDNRRAGLLIGSSDVAADSNWHYSRGKIASPISQPRNAAHLATL
ncbi:MAG: hypothetical protein KF832_19935 [Caldilineaceae bacterium]|nr:hypothetical protein [Caldilineaceae bacterium]